MANDTAAARAQARRESRAVAVFGTWMLTGLFLDGWAHNTNKPETFFSPWHGILYSGFVAAVLWFAWDGRRQAARARQAGAEPVTSAVDRVATAGIVLFVAGAVGDGVWHSVFGIEVDLEALLSPTHLALMIGGAMMVTAPFRFGWDWLPDRPAMREFLPTLASVTLASSLVLFFLMYLSANSPIALLLHEEGHGWGIASVLTRTTVVVGATFLVLRRWTPPPGSFVVLYAVPAVALAGLQGFEFAALVVPFVVGGIAADALVARQASLRVVGLLVPLVTWLSYFAVHAVAWDVRWPAEIWTGAVTLASLAGVALALLAGGLDRPATTAPAAERAPAARR